MKNTYSFISLSRACRLVGITRQGYYKRAKVKRIKATQSSVVLKLVQQVRNIHPKIGGRKLYHMIKSDLQEHNIKMGRDDFFRVLGENNLLIRKRKRRHITTWSGHPYRKYPNLIKEIVPQKPNQIWASDITYLKKEKGHYYLSLITDIYSRKIVGYNLSDNLESVNALQALKMAIKNNPESINKLIHHSDRGIQYCTHEYVRLLNEKGIKISMTQNGDPLENAIAERINGIIKNEYMVQKPVTNKQQAKQLLENTIVAYNKHRPHLSCGMKTPDYVHENQSETKRLWKSYYKKKEPVNLLQD